MHPKTSWVSSKTKPGSTGGNLSHSRFLTFSSRKLWEHRVLTKRKSNRSGSHWCHSYRRTCSNSRSLTCKYLARMIKWYLWGEGIKLFWKETCRPRDSRERYSNFLMMSETSCLKMSILPSLWVICSKWTSEARDSLSETEKRLSRNGDPWHLNPSPHLPFSRDNNPRKTSSKKKCSNSIRNPKSLRRGVCRTLLNLWDQLIGNSHHPVTDKAKTGW